MRRGRGCELVLSSSQPLPRPAYTGVMARATATAAAAGIPVDDRLARRLILDELFDLSLYRSLSRVAHGRQREVLEELIPVEVRHLAFWQEFFELRLDRLDPLRRLQLAA